MKNSNSHFHELISLVVELEQDNLDKKKFQSRFIQSLGKMTQIDLARPKSFGEAINLAIKSCPQGLKRSLAIVMIRLIGNSNNLTEEDLKNSRRDIVDIVESNCPDLTKGLVDIRDQNHDKVHAMTRIHTNAMAKLEELLQPFASLEDLAARRNTIMRAINHPSCGNYLAQLEYITFRTSIESLLGQVSNVLKLRGYEKQAAIEQLVKDIPFQNDNCAKCGTFLYDQFAQPFLDRLAAAALDMQKKLLVDFHCDFSIPASSIQVEKRYPLHHTDRTIEVPLSLENTGPGIGQNVRLTYVADNCTIENEETNLGSVNPGPIVVTLDIALTTPQSELLIEVEITWNIVGNSRDNRKSFTTRIRGQRTDIDWNAVSQQSPPYSLEVVAEKDFYGRHDVLDQVVNRLTSLDMQSCFVTGQKRVGKSSLVRAVQSRIERIESEYTYDVLYLESGEFRHSSGSETLGELGTLLETFFSSACPPGSTWEPRDYSSSLTALNRLVQDLHRASELQRFIVILDEFDEINESLYLHGELASTFFLNLRTLASKRNLAFVLVGAEKMPYLMSLQGEKLNKFSPVSLDSFDIQNEWLDYRALIQEPVENLLTFHDDALRRIYELSDGHPYFSKALCSALFVQAVKARDAEISYHDIQIASRSLVNALDTNAFAHYWRDGVRGDIKDVEIISARRCKILIAWARTIRNSVVPTRPEIKKLLSPGRQEIDLRRELEDFCRRGIFKETKGEYRPTVELFGQWLQNGGFSRLVDSQLGDEYESEKQNVEDNAHVLSEEIVSLTNKWRHYQGRRITADDVRVWIEQVQSKVEQRYLFTLLQHVRFVADEHIKEAFLQSYNSIAERVPWVRHPKRSRRSDIFVTYLGGITRSGIHYARQFALASRIATGNVVSSKQLHSKLSQDTDRHSVSAVVIVDDMVATGDSMVEGLQSIRDMFDDIGVGVRIPLYICIFCATVDGAKNVTRHIDDMFADCELLIHEMLEEKHWAFYNGNGIWDSEVDFSKAKSLVTDLGRRIDKRRPLGFKGQGLLLVFSRNCPNNSLPILYGNGRTIDAPWNPIFPRET